MKGGDPVSAFTEMFFESDRPRRPASIRREVARALRRREAAKVPPADLEAARDVSRIERAAHATLSTISDIARDRIEPPFAEAAE